jgi:hypothetical protein
MGKFYDLVKQKGYNINPTPVKTVRIPTVEEYNEKKQQWENPADVVDSLGTAKTAFNGGLLAELPNIGSEPIRPMIPVANPLSKAPALGNTGLTAGTEQQVLDRKQDRIAQMEQDREALELLEGEYGILANDALPEDQRAQYQAQYDDLKEKYGADITAERLYDMTEQERSGLNAQKDANLTVQNMEKIRSLPAEDYNTLLRYASARNQQITVGPKGQLSVPRLEIQTDPDVKALIAKYGKDTVNELAETLGRGLTADAAAAYRQAGEEVGSTLGFGAVPITVGAGILGAPVNLLGIVNDRLNSTGQYSTADPNQAGGFLSTFTQGANQAAAKKAPEQMLNLLELMGNANPYSTEMGNFNATPMNYTPQLYEASRGTRAGEIIDAVGAGAYQVVNTAADSVARACLGGALLGPGTTAAKAATLGLAGVRSFGDTYNDVSKKGGTPGQAALLGVFNAGTEVATEYLPLEEWWKVAEKGVDGVVPMLKEAVRQGALEATQEEIGFLATSLAEYAVLREKSEYQVLKKELMDQGYSEAVAERMMWEEFGKQALGVAATSFFSGGLSELGAAAFHSLMPGAVTTQTQEQADNQEAQPSATPTPQTQEQNQEAVPNAEVAPQEQTPLQKAQDYYRQNGTVSNSLARAILADSDSLAVLQEQADLQLGYTDSQRRNEVEAAVARLTGAAETSQSAATDLSESIADSIAETQAETQQTAQETEQSGNVDEAVSTALRGEKPKGVEYVPARRAAVKNSAERAGANRVQSTSLRMGMRVRPADRNNVGTIVGRNPETGQYSVRFVSEDGRTATVDFDKSMLAPIGTRAGGKSGGGGVATANAPASKSASGSPDTADSKLYTNTYPNATDPVLREGAEVAAKENPGIMKYKVAHEDDSVAAARARTQTDDDVLREYETLLDKPMWSGEDNDTAMIVLKRLFENGEIEKHGKLSAKQRELATNAGQFNQSFAKYSRMDAMTAASEGLSLLQSLGKDDVDKRYWGKADGKTDEEKFGNWVKDIAAEMANIGKVIDQVKDGDIETMRGIVRELAQFRRTTAWFGISNNLTKAADKGINRLDFETLRTVAKAQLGQIPNDYKKVSAGQVIKSISIMNMLSSLVTVNRNLVGNATTGLMDAFSDSGAGRLADYVLSKVTGIRTVGDDIRYSKEYFKGAWDAACMASLVTELAIPMDNAAYTDPTRTFSPQGNLLTRFLSGYEMGLKYALEVTDKFFEGGTKASVMASLKEMGAKSGLTELTANVLAGQAAARRTYKDDRALARATSGVKAGLNHIPIVTEDVGAGDVFMPFAKVPANVVHVGIDYSAGIVEGLDQMIKVAKAAKAGKGIEATAQRAAVTNFGRGVSGAAMIAMFTALAAKGAIKVFDDDDRDKASLEQSLGYDDAVWNLSASWRLLTGKDGAWKPDDIKINLGFLQPFNAQMYIGAELAEEDSFWDMVKAIPGATVSGIANSIMDIPMFQTFEDVVDIAKSFGEVGEDPEAVMDATGKLVGNVATRAIPSWLRQTAQYIDPYYRDTGGDDAMEKAGKQFLSAIPGASKLLPKKYDGLGNPQMRYTDPVLGFFNTFVSPGKITGATAPDVAYDITEYLGELEAATDKKTMYPDYKAPTEFTWDGEKVELSKEQQNEYQRVYGENIADMYAEFMRSETFRSFPADIQLSILEDAKGKADDLAKEYITGNGTGKPESLNETVNGLLRGEIDSVLTKGVSGYLGGKTDKGMGQIGSALSIYDAMTESGKTAMRDAAGGRAKYLLLAHDEGMDPEKFLGYYQHYASIDEKKLSAAKKDAEWSIYLQREREQGRITADQERVLRDNLLYWSQMPGQAVKVDQLRESGLSSGAIENIVSDIDLLRPLEGYETVTNWQKYEAIAGSGESTADIDAAMLAYMPDYDPDAKSPNRTELKYQDIREMGYTPAQFIALHDVYDAGGGKAAIVRAINALPYVKSYREAQLLWSIFDGDYYKK